MRQGPVDSAPHGRHGHARSAALRCGAAAEALRNGTLVDPFKVKPLTQEQILAARRRRSKEWCAQSRVCEVGLSSTVT